MKNKISHARGISLIQLILAIIIITIISIIVIQKTNNYINNAKKSAFFTTMSSLDEEVTAYFYSHNELPVKKDASGNPRTFDINTVPSLKDLIKLDSNLDKIETKFYIIDITKLGAVTAKDGLEKSPDDVYIVASKSMNVYYVKGIVVAGSVYHSYMNLRLSYADSAAPEGATSTPTPTPTPLPDITGTGTAGDPFIIGTINGLDMVRNNLSAYYQLGCDIDASATSTWNSGAGFVPIGNYTTPFTGKFDGKGFKITSLYINRSGLDYIGLFGRIYNATITNVALSSANIGGHYHTGGIVGGTDSSSVTTISNCSASGTISGYSHVGGIAGDIDGTSTTIAKCFSSGTIIPTYAFSDAGGIVGYMYCGTISNSYSRATISSNTIETGGLIGYASGSSSSVINCYSTGSAYAGGLIGSGSPTVTNSYWNITTSGKTTSSSGTGLRALEMQQQSSFVGWDFTNTWVFDSSINSGYPYLKDSPDNTIYNDINYSSLFAGGAGTSSDPCKITNVTQLQNVKYDLGANYILMNDIDASATSTWNSGAGFVPIGNYTTPFTGKFDGKGFKITSLYINRSGLDYIGLFGKIYNATITNVALSSANTGGHYHTGGIVGGADGSSVTTISNCSASGTISGYSHVGGIAGDIDGTSTTIAKCFSSGTIIPTYAFSDAGGIVGYMYCGTISNSYSRATISSNTTETGGLIGYASGSSSSVINCYSTGSAYAGGLIGSGSPTVTNSYWNITTSGKTTSSGGTGKTTAEMLQQSTYTDWDFSTIWDIDGVTNGGYPFLI